MTEIKISICLISIFVVGNKKDIIIIIVKNSFNLSVDKPKFEVQFNMHSFQ